MKTIPMNPKIIEQLQSIVGENRVKTDADSLLVWGCDWTKHYTPCASAIVFPVSTEEVQAIVHLANVEKFPLVRLREDAPVCPLGRWRRMARLSSALTA